MCHDGGAKEQHLQLASALHERACSWNAWLKVLISRGCERRFWVFSQLTSCTIGRKRVYCESVKLKPLIYRL